MRRGQRRPAQAALLPASGRVAGGGPPARLPHGLPAGRAPRAGASRGPTRRSSATSTGSPICCSSSPAARTCRRRGAAVGAGPATGERPRGCIPPSTARCASCTRSRASSAATGRGSADRLGGAPATCSSGGVEASQELLARAGRAHGGATGCTASRRRTGAGVWASRAARRGRPAARAQPGAARARCSTSQHVTHAARLPRRAGRPARRRRRSPPGTAAGRRGCRALDERRARRRRSPMAEDPERRGRARTTASALGRAGHALATRPRDARRGDRRLAVGRAARSAR